jgi:hypothetical protein
MDRDTEILAEMVIEKFLDYQGFSEWFDGLSNEKVDQIYDEVNQAVKSWFDCDDCYEMAEE